MDVDWYLTSVLIVLWGSAIRASGNECDSNESLACKKELANLKEFKQKYQYVSDNHTLNEMCKLQLLVIDCVNSFAKSCLQKGEQEEFKILIKGSDKFFDYFCFENSQLRKRYLRHSGCIRNITSNLEDCTKEYESSQKILENHEGGNINTFKQRTCCLYFENISCSANATLDNCGEEASELVRDLWSLLGGTYLNELCEPFSKYDFHNCSPISKGTRTDARFITVVFSVLYTAVSYYLR